MEESYLRHISEIGTADIRTLMETYGEEVWNYAYFLTKNAHSADDIAQEAFIKAYRSFHTYRGQASVKTWLLKITRNTAFSYKKLAFFRKVVLLGGSSSDDLSHSAPSPETEIVEREAADEIWNVVLQLPRKFRDPFVLHFHHQLSMEEIAGILEISEGTVKSRIYRAKRRVAEALKGEYGHE